MISFDPYSTQISKKDFCAADYYHLSKDELARFAPSFDLVISYALVSINNEKNPIAYQFAFPAIVDPHFPRVKALKSISLGNGLPTDVIQAVTEDNIEMRTQRVINIETHSLFGETNTYRLFFFFPVSAYTASQNLTWAIDSSDFDDANDLSPADLFVEPSVKKGGSINVNFSNILYRYNLHTASEPNIETMGRSAIEAYALFHEKYGPVLPEAYNKMVQKSILAGNPYDLKSSLHSFKRPEWCHALAKSFHPSHKNPQTADNIGAAPFWMNSQMMIIEESLRWHAKTYPHAKITLKSTFKAFPDTDVIASGKMNASVRTSTREVCISQDLEPFQLFPAYPKSTDVAITTFIMNNLLIDKCPTLIPMQEMPREEHPSNAASSFYIHNDDEIEQIMLQIPESQLQATTSAAVMESNDGDDDEIEQIMLQIPESLFHAKTSLPFFPLESPSLTLTPARSLHALAAKQASQSPLREKRSQPESNIKPGAYQDHKQARIL